LTEDALLTEEALRGKHLAFDTRSFGMEAYESGLRGGEIG
jgi:hypothetical protein